MFVYSLALSAIVCLSVVVVAVAVVGFVPARARRHRRCWRLNDSWRAVFALCVRPLARVFEFQFVGEQTK